MRHWQRRCSDLGAAVPKEAKKKIAFFLELELFGLAHGLQVDSQLLALLIEVAAFETHRPGHIGHVKILTVNFRQQYFPFETFGALGKRSGSRSAVG